MKLIDKDALMAEIERLEEEKGAFYASDVLYNLEDFIDTLEVKEVDLEKLFDDYMFPITAQDIEEEPFTQLDKCAKHFFALGLSASNLITAADKGMAEEIIINLKRIESDYRIDLTKEIEWVRNKAQKGE